MHEMAVTQSILDIALDHAQRVGATRVTDLNLVVGPVVLHCRRFGAVLLGLSSARSTLREGAQLHFERVPAQMLCLDCGQSYVLTGGLQTAPPATAFMCASAAAKNSAWKVLK